MNLTQAIKILEKWERLFTLHVQVVLDEDSDEFLCAIKIALPIMRAAMKEEERREIRGAVCGNCGRWKRDYETKAGGYCPIPVRGRSCQKYKTRASKACMNFAPK